MGMRMGKNKIMVIDDGHFNNGGEGQSECEI